MPRIIIIRHESEIVQISEYSIALLARFWCDQGYEVMVARGCTNLPDGDIAFLHVDLSVVPDEYVAAARRYPRVINGNALDIRKRVVSRNLVAQDDEWNGPVLVKADLNYGGIPEWRVAERAGESHCSSPFTDYRIYEKKSEVPQETWSMPEVVVERFLPERRAEGFGLRTWLFLGDRDRCRLFFSQDPIAKAATLTQGGDSEIPERLRAERERLGFDYGKFDFVIHEGEPILFDANKTPGSPPASPSVLAGYRHLSQGLTAHPT